MKIAAFDFDGTLHHPQREALGGGAVSSADVAAIRAWRAAGNLAISATGRSRNELRRGTSDTGLAFDYNILSNGAAATTGSDELLFAHSLPVGVVREAEARFGARDHLAICGTTWSATDWVFANSAGEPNPLIAHFSHLPAAELDARTDLEFTVLVFWVPDSPDADALRTDVMDWARQHGSVEFAVNQQFIDVMAPGRTKASGLIDVTRHANLDLTEVPLYTFGDSFNDLPMHELATVSHSLTHSPVEVQDATDAVVDSVASVLLDYL